MNSQPRKSFKTKNGTDLPLLNLKGKEYLQVASRLLWFHEERPEWSIETEFSIETNEVAKAKATIRDEKGRIRSTGHKLETLQGFSDFHEKAETGAIGRALALIGYGTQFTADEMEEGERIVDAPQANFAAAMAAAAVVASVKPASTFAPPEKKPVFKIPPLHPPEAEVDINWAAYKKSVSGFDPGEYVMPFGKDYKGKNLRQCDATKLAGFALWMKNQAKADGKILTGKNLDTYCFIQAYLHQLKDESQPPDLSSDEIPF